MRGLPVFFVALAACSFHAHANCVLPQSPSKIPDGATATKEEMIAGRKALTQYNTDVGAFNACIDDEMVEMADKMTPKATVETAQRIAEMKLASAKRVNAQIDKLQDYANKFNEQLRVFKAKQANN